MAPRTSDPKESPPALLAVDAGASALLDRIGVGALLSTPDGEILVRNPRVPRSLPHAPTLERTFSAVRFAVPVRRWANVLAPVLEQGELATFECVIQGPGPGTRSLLRLRCVPIRPAEEGAPASVLILIEEGTEPADAVQRVEISRRLTALGKLAARVAHELNNPLDGILRYINLAIRLAGETQDPRLRDYLSESRTGLMRMVQIIGDLLEFSRTTDGQFEQATINEIVEQAIAGYAAPAEANRVVVAADFQNREMPTVRGSRLYQVCCNLIKNAIEAMPDGGRLTITCGIVADRVVIRVADTGPGLPVGDPQKVFEPFFTTKGAGKGTGIGLAICRDFVEDMKGTITAVDGEQGGAVFTVALPLDACQSPAARISGRRA